MKLSHSTAAAAALLTFVAGDVSAQTPRANGETLNIQQYAGTTGNMQATIAKEKGFCAKYNFTCALKIINSGSLGLQTLVGKSIDVALTGTDLTASTINAGADLVIVGTSIKSTVLILTARSDVPLPNKPKGYPAVMADFKGLKIGVPARGSAAEVYMNVMLRDAGLQASDVTYVGVGGPATAYTAMAVGKQVDAVIVFEPIKALCNHTKNCTVVVDLTLGEGPRLMREMSSAGIPMIMRRDFVEANPALMAAFYAAMTDAAAWMHDPANFDDVVKIYTPLINFGDIGGGEELRRSWLKTAIPTYSRDLSVDRKAVKATIDFGVEAKTLDRPVEVSRIVWGKAP